MGWALDQGPAFLVPGVAAWQVLERSGRFERGQSVLVHSAAGGVGTLAVQLAKVFGASTVTAGTAAKRRIAQELGVDSVVDYRSERWPQEVLAATGGRGVDVVLVAVGGDVGEQSLACLAPFGCLVTYGVTSQRLASFAGSQLMYGNDSGSATGSRPGSPSTTTRGRSPRASSARCSAWPRPAACARSSRRSSRLNGRPRRTARCPTAARSARSC